MRDHEGRLPGLLFKDVLVDVIRDGSKTTYQSVTPIMVERIVQDHLVGGEPVASWAVSEDYAQFHEKQYKMVLGPCGEIDPESIDDYIAMQGYRAAEKAMTRMTPEDVIDEVVLSGLRGRGGSGYLTGEKWKVCRREDAFPKYGPWAVRAISA